MNTESVAEVQGLFDRAIEHIKNKEFGEAEDDLEQLIRRDGECLEGLSNLGLVYCELGRYDEAVEQYNKIPKENRTSRTWFNLAIAEYYRHGYHDAIEAYDTAILLDANVLEHSVLSEAHFNLGILYFEIGDIASATRSVDESLRHDDRLACAWALKGRISIENDDCDKATQSFANAIAFHRGADLTFLIWEAYGRYLKAEFSPSPERERLIVSVIRKLERVDRLANTLREHDIRAYALYFLSCAYCKQGDYLTSKKRLEECISLQTKTSIGSLAQELLESLWDTKIRPPWWRWWITSTSMKLRILKTAIFSILTILLITMMVILFAHPFLTQIPYVRQAFSQDKINLEVYLVTVALLIIIILSPSIEQVKARDFEIKVQAPISINVIPSSAQMEQEIGAMRRATIITEIQ